MRLREVFRISRFRFWAYILGPFSLGLSACFSLESFNWWLASLLVIYFTFPANLLIYGVNDIFDYETDKINPKKQEYETLVAPKKAKILTKYILIFNLPFLLLLPFLNWQSILCLAGFLFFSIFYSAEPIRAKSKPILDSLFNILYVLPGFFGYYALGGVGFDLRIFLAAWFFCIAMHAYSAVPDIEADKKSNTSTIATLFGFKNTILFCAVFYMAGFSLVFDFIGFLAVAGAVAYSFLMFLSLFNPDKIFTIYKIFPIVNNVFGSSTILLLLLHIFQP